MSNAVRADALGCERGHIGSRLDSVTLYDRVNAETRLRRYSGGNLCGLQ
jgi:hypothetical protein